MFLIDTHSHINFNDFKEDGDEALKRALDQNIWVINVGSQYETSKRAIEYSNKYQEGVYAAVGLHPIHLEETDIDEEESGAKFKTRKEEFDFEKYWEMAQERKVVAIGEIGLDYKSVNGEQRTKNNKEKQKEVLKQQMEISQQMNLPIIFHCREAYDDLIKILEDFKGACASCAFGCPGAGAGGARGVIHCFCGNIETSKKFLEMDLYLGFNGLITFSNQYDEVVKETPLENILLETDCPYLAPPPYRGKRNEPAYVKYVAEKIAKIKGIRLDEAAEQTTKNAKDLFNL
jgi:TatD DNase family protein